MQAHPTIAPGGTPSGDAAQVSYGEPKYGGSATFYFPKLYNYFDPAAKNQFGYMLWLECLWKMDWGLNDSSVFAFGSSYITYDYLAGQVAESWTFAADWSYMEVTIRDNIYFQTKDGGYNIFGGCQLTAQVTAD